jgi:hypothetical protein
MIRAVIAVAILVLALMAVFGQSDAAPIAPLPASVADEAGGSVAPIYYGHHRHWGYRCRWHRC